MNLYEFNRMFLAMQMEIYDLEKELATLQLEKDERELKIKEIQKKLNEENKKMQKIEEIQQGIEELSKEYPRSYHRRVQIIPDGEDWKLIATITVGGYDDYRFYNGYQPLMPSGLG